MKKKAFTLVELLIVIVIIGILATLVTLALSSATNKAKETKTKNAVAQVQRAMIAVVADATTLTPLAGCVNATNPTVWTPITTVCTNALGGFSTLPKDGRGHAINIRGAVDGSTFWVSGQTMTNGVAKQCWYATQSDNTGLTTSAAGAINCAY